MKKIELVIFDWAGTTVDYGSMAPVTVFKNIFEKENIFLDNDQINEFMGLEKKDHIRSLLKTPEINEMWLTEKGKPWDDLNVDMLYLNFEKELGELVGEYSVPIKGVIETVEQLRCTGVKIGSSTGYSHEIMADVVERAAKLGYRPDCVITPDQVNYGRPSPFMVFEAMRKLDVADVRKVVKVGDTIADIKEGNNGGVWTVGLIEGSNLLGLTDREYSTMDLDELQSLKEKVALKYYEAGADFVIENITDLPIIIDEINKNYLNKNIYKKIERGSFYNPVKVIYGENALAELEDIINELPEINNILIISWSKNVFNVNALLELERNTNIKINKKVFAKSNPSLKDLLKLYKEVRYLKSDLIVGIGGGSVMDLSKSLCLIKDLNLHSTEDLRKIIANKSYSKSLVKWIGVPTTSGTGSEVTCWATVWDEEYDKKLSIASKQNYAYAAIVDSTLLHSQPTSIAISSAIDALAHAIESYWSKNTNVISRAHALTAIRLVVNHLEGVLGGERDALHFVSQGSLLSGLAFSNTKTTACHSISYPLTMKYGIPHGVAVGLLLAPLMYYNESKIINKKALFDSLKIKSTDELFIKIRKLFKKAGLPSTLREWGVREEEIEKLVELSNTPERFDNNPIELSEYEVEKILKKAF